MSSHEGRAHLDMKQLHKLTPALTEAWDQTLGSCGSAQTAEIRVQYLLKWWKGKTAYLRVKQPT